MEVVMNFEQEERLAHKARKIKKRQELFSAKRPFRSTKAGKVRCGTKGCRNEAITLKGKVPDCGQHK